MLQPLKTETLSELIQRLRLEFFPLDVQRLAAEYLATGRKFRASDFVMFCTRRWRQCIERGGLQ